jgi:hypothetical protein
MNRLKRKKKFIKEEIGEAINSQLFKNCLTEEEIDEYIETYCNTSTSLLGIINYHTTQITNLNNTSTSLLGLKNNHTTSLDTLTTNTNSLSS